MPALLATLGATLGSIGVKLLMSLMTEAFLKKALIVGLEKLVKMTDTDTDDQLLQAAKQAWGVDKEGDK